MKASLSLLLLCFGCSEAQDFANLSIERVASGLHYANGPVYNREGYLLFSDVPTSRLLRLDANSKLIPFREDSHGAAGNAIDTQGRIYTCETHARRVTRTNKKGDVEVLADRYLGKRLNAPNDLVVRHDGHLYFTDPAFGKESESRELDFYGVYHLPPKGPLELIAKPKGRPNGIALSQNGKQLYVSNSDEKNIRVYELDGKGEASSERIFASNIQGVPNGLRLDDKGNVYLASLGLLVFAPDGKLLKTIELVEPPSNCAFGDSDFSSIYVTARTSIYRVRLGVKGANSN